MKEELVTFETAKLAKEIGFNEKTNFAFYYDGTETWNDPGYDILIARPTQSLLQRWLREKYSLHVFVSSHNNKWVSIVENNFKPYKWIDKFETFEEALESGLQEALKLIK